ncbi:MAG: DUF92 domain-containing protein [Chloroflexaceae bacterium]|nr:DUF92 domain-containing protein [Chloroflexaceae bacterium]
MLDLGRITLGLVLSTAIGGAAYWRRSLTLSGWLGAIVTGTLTFGFGGWAWGLTLITFFVSSTLLSRFKARVKEQRTGEKFAKGGQRDFGQAMANGGIGALLAWRMDYLVTPTVLLAAFAGVMATVTADTWATEIGTLSRQQPRLITTGRMVETGTSGGITLLGTAATVGGALLIGVVLPLFLWAEQQSTAWWVLPAALLGGVAGSLTDSLLGATVQVLYRRPDGAETERATAQDGTPYQYARGWRWMNNDIVNLTSSLVGALVGVAVGAVWGG